ncbi:MAG: hypothetical protein K0R29_1549 [Pseudobdellovibrio sp.]|jgi:hypothetical protein|nr:hypothetical protein [Pseudobdellovibrio sp.]
MKKILRDYYLLVLLVLIAGFFSKTAFAGEMKVQYFCQTDKLVSYETAEGPLASALELRYSPEPGKSLNLMFGRFPSQYQFWIRQPQGQTKRFASVFHGTRMLSQSIELGEEGQESTAVFPFQLKDGNETINGQCEIRVQ